MRDANSKRHGPGSIDAPVPKPRHYGELAARLREAGRVADVYRAASVAGPTALARTAETLAESPGWSYLADSAERQSGTEVLSRLVHIERDLAENPVVAAHSNLDALQGVLLSAEQLGSDLARSARPLDSTLYEQLASRFVFDLLDGN